LRFFQVSILDHLKEEDFWNTFYNKYNIIDVDCLYFSTTEEECEKSHAVDPIDKKEQSEHDFEDSEDDIY